jgi:pentose-5-phosphate-3-epimerase
LNRYENEISCHHVIIHIYRQECSTGVTAEGKTPKTLVEEMVPLLDSQEVM